MLSFQLDHCLTDGERTVGGAGSAGNNLRMPVAAKRSR
jgi:hypothetical protein